MKILSWNVNGLRAVQKKGFADWLRKARPDILCVQESRALPEQVEPDWPESYEALDFDHFFLQPMDTTGIASCGQPTTPLDAALAYCMANPQWRLSLQTHKTLGIE